MEVSGYMMDVGTSKLSVFWYSHDSLRITSVKTWSKWFCYDLVKVSDNIVNADASKIPNIVVIIFYWSILNRFCWNDYFNLTVEISINRLIWLMKLIIPFQLQQKYSISSWCQIWLYRNRFFTLLSSHLIISFKNGLALNCK